MMNPIKPILALLAFVAAPATAAEINLWCPPALRGFMAEMVPPFETASGHKLVMRFEVMPVMKRQMDAGAAFDVAILTADLMDQAIAQGRFVPATRAVIARTGAGLAVAKGAAKPDIGSIAAFKQTLLKAKSIGYTADGATGNAVLAMLERIGVASELKRKLKPYPGGGAVMAAARGEVEMTITTIPGILDASGTDLVGPLPSELQSYVVFTAAVGAQARDAAAARSFLAFLTGPAAASVLKAKGLDLPPL